MCTGSPMCVFYFVVSYLFQTDCRGYSLAQVGGDDPAGEQEPSEGLGKADGESVGTPKVERPFHRCPLIGGPQLPRALDSLPYRVEGALSDYSRSKRLPHRGAACQQVDGRVPFANLVGLQDGCFGEARLSGAQLGKKESELPALCGKIPGGFVPLVRHKASPVKTVPYAEWSRFLK
jgi:hypothetical protein